ncbi:TorF family putative porin [Guyparkeria hydrothermalis]|uniref:TorF family putative porin n=1 Tax=Guyparkeria hydrothermalis TaxID=923 RepID=UPI0020200C57|nr:TorF family putative porin [Guyparkeria hydrothermalis]MCL7744949.1 TorF family putative porin [Guyparkeria hydrothermalis]
MKKTLIATSIASAVSLSALTLPSVAAAEVSANIGVVSNYLFRGITQTDDSAAVQGGLDYAHESGLYAGTWASTVDFGDDTSYEIDFYAGYGGSIGDLGYDVGYIYYAYPDAPSDIDFGEIYGSLTYSYLTAGLAYTVNGQADDGPFTEGDLYYYAGVDVPFGESGYTGSLYYGYYTFDDDGDVGYGDMDYGHWTASVAKDAGDFGSFTMSFEMADVDDTNYVSTDDDLQVWVGWSKSF